MGFLCSRMVFIPFNVDFMDQNLFWFLGKQPLKKMAKKNHDYYFMMEPWFLREKTMDLKPQKISARFRQGSLATLNSVTDSQRQQIQAGELNRPWEMGVGRVASIKLLGWRTSLPTVIGPEPSLVMERHGILKCGPCLQQFHWGEWTNLQKRYKGDEPPVVSFFWGDEHLKKPRLLTHSHSRCKRGVSLFRRKGGTPKFAGGFKGKSKIVR